MENKAYSQGGNEGASHRGGQQEPKTEPHQMAAKNQPTPRQAQTPPNSITRRSRLVQLKEIGLFTYNTSREAAFLVVKEPYENEYRISNIREGSHGKMFYPPYVEEDNDPNSFSAARIRLDNYTILDVHTHDGQYGAIVPSLKFDTHYGNPQGDLNSLKDDRVHFRQVSGYDIKPLMGIEKMRSPTQFDLLLIQEKTDKPLEVSELIDVENAMKWYHESERVLTPEESFKASQEVVEALKETGFYNAELVRYRRGRTLKEDLAKLVAFEFDEIRLQRPNSPACS